MAIILSQWMLPPRPHVSDWNMEHVKYNKKSQGVPLSNALVCNVLLCDCVVWLRYLSDRALAYLIPGHCLVSPPRVLLTLLN